MIFIPISIILLCSNLTWAFSEEYYQAQFCQAHHGIMEYRLSDGTRVDCFTDEYAVEVEFAPKWYQAIGQALHYGRMTGKKPAIYLILRSPKDKRYLTRLKAVIQYYKLPIFIAF